MTILSALNSLYARMAEAGEAPRRGYSTEKIGGEVVIDRDGTLVAINPKLVADGKRMVAAQIAVPAAVKRSSGTAPNFLWDKTAYVLGVTAQKDDKGKPILVDGRPVPAQERRTADEHAAFVALHRERLAASEDEGLVALPRFLERWNREDFATRACPADVLTNDHACQPLRFRAVLLGQGWQPQWRLRCGQPAPHGPRNQQRPRHGCGDQAQGAEPCRRRQGHRPRLPHLIPARHIPWTGWRPSGSRWRPRGRTGCSRSAPPRG